MKSAIYKGPGVFVRFDGYLPTCNQSGHKSPRIIDTFLIFVDNSLIAAFLRLLRIL